MFSLATFSGWYNSEEFRVEGWDAVSVNFDWNIIQPPHWWFVCWETFSLG